MLKRNQWALIFDGTCGFCSASVRSLGRVDWRRRLVPMPNQLGGLAEAVRLPATALEFRVGHLPARQALSG